jgi:hypothetical protein
MSYKSLFTALWSIAEGLGYTPTLGCDLHRTLIESGFPIASFGLAEITSMEGHREPRREYEVVVKFMCSNVVGAPQRSEAIASLMESAGRFVALLEEAPTVAAVELLELKPEERLMTVAGECAVSLKIRVESLECSN